MSGHSKWATIHRDKAINDNARGKVFSKLSRAITIAVKTGGGPNPDSNYRLKIAIEAAKAENMPKDTIERAINKAAGGEQLDEVSYEGFGPAGVNIIVQSATDNRNRTAQEVKSIFERSGGSLGQPGSVSFNFESRGFIFVSKGSNLDEQILSLIDLGADEVEERPAGIEVYTKSSELSEMRNKIEKAGFTVLQSELIQKPKTEIELDRDKAQKLLTMLDALEALDDTQKVFDNAHIPEHVMKSIGS